MQSLREKIGQMFLVGCQETSLSRDEALIFAEYQFGGFILFQRNCADAAQLVSLSRCLWESDVEIPPFIAIDQEGGRVHRLPEPFTHFPSAASIGGTNDSNLAYRLGRAVANELRLVGINLNFAPVLDVNSNSLNPVIGDRSFSTEPKQVSEIASACARGLRDGGIIPCGKHFPGHGDTEKDSHVELPSVRKTLVELQTTELAPFAHACRNTIESLMTAHVIYSALDPNLPATLSEPIVTGLLRHQFGFDGVVFSDDMAMKAISGNYNVEEAAGLAVRAGVDVLLFCHGVENAMAACEFLCDEAEREPAVRAQVENSYRRITELKRRYLKSFTGVAANELTARLVELNYRRLIDDNFGAD
jgi:beta-N-acetylhexosaminidase